MSVATDARALAVTPALSIGRRLVLWPIRFYQRWLSPLKPAPTCRFAPTCSAYAAEAIARRGTIVGLGLALWRLVRCNPLCRGGLDPVPEHRGSPHRQSASHRSGQE